MRYSRIRKPITHWQSNVRILISNLCLLRDEFGKEFQYSFLRNIEKSWQIYATQNSRQGTKDWEIPA